MYGLLIPLPVKLNIRSAKEDGIDTGVALLLEPTPEFYVSKDDEEREKYNAFSFLYAYLRPYNKSGKTRRAA